MTCVENQGISIATLAMFLKVIDLGLGLHAEAFPAENLYMFFKIMYIYSTLIIFGYSFIKLSIGFFLLRLADRTRWKPFLIGILGTRGYFDNEMNANSSKVFLATFTLGSTFAIIFQCLPIQASWDFTLRPPTGSVRIVVCNVL